MDMYSLILDLDHTLIKGASWDILAKCHLNSSEMKTYNELTKEYLPNVMDESKYMEWMSKAAVLFKDKGVKKGVEYLKYIHYVEGHKEIDYSNFNYIMILSGGINIIADIVGYEIGIRNVYSLVMGIKEMKFTGAVFYPRFHYGDLSRICRSMKPVFVNVSNKKHGFDQLCDYLRMDPRNTVVVADGLGEIPIFEVCGIAIGINVKDKKVESSVDYIIEDLSDINEIMKKGI